MDWLRWWHGTVTDPKFLWISRNAEQPLANVIAVWASLLEYASHSVDRGSFEGFCCMDYDLLLGLDDGATDAILAALEVRGMVADSCIVNWEKRQPKREDDSAERVRRHREKKRAVTQCNAEKRAVTPRGEEIREDKNKKTISCDFEEIFWPAYPRKTNRAAAEKAFDKLSPDETLLQTILAHIQKRQLEGDWADKSYIPHASTFLNGKRWEDEIIPRKESIHKRPEFTLPADNEKLWDWAKQHGYSNPGQLTRVQYRQKLIGEIDVRMNGV